MERSWISIRLWNKDEVGDNVRHAKRFENERGAQQGPFIGSGDVVRGLLRPCMRYQGLLPNPRNTL